MNYNTNSKYICTILDFRESNIYEAERNAEIDASSVPLPVIIEEMPSTGTPTMLGPSDGYLDLRE